MMAGFFSKTAMLGVPIIFLAGFRRGERETVQAIGRAYADTTAILIGANSGREVSPPSSGDGYNPGEVILRAKGIFTRF